MQMLWVNEFQVNVIGRLEQVTWYSIDGFRSTNEFLMEERVRAAHRQVQRWKRARYHRTVSEPFFRG